LLDELKAPFIRDNAPAGPNAGQLAPLRASLQKDGTDWVSGLPFFALHLVPFAIIATGFSTTDAIIAGSLYVARMFFITAGYHRYFSHKSYQLGRAAQLVMAVGGATAVQKGPLWWAGHHRRHHRYADTPRDVHSPREGFWWSHVGWVLSRRYKAIDWEAVPDLAKFPELVAVDRWHLAAPTAMGAACLVFAGWGGVVAFCVSTIALWHATFSVNSVAHLWGRRRYQTPDTSRNCWPVALLTLGEGWHNNHHHYPLAVRQGHRWWEIDPAWYALCVLEALGLARGLRPVPTKALVARLAKDKRSVRR
jgi:stearoyl-CoA desaturase (delta-9 desaturase)